MPKVRKVQKKKAYRVDVNRKRLFRKSKKLPNITCPQIKEAWANNKTTKTNLVQMGLAYDANKSIQIPSFKTKMVKSAKRKALGELSDSDSDEKIPKKKNFKKVQVALALEAEAKAPRVRMFRLPSSQVHFLTYLMDKYNDDYRAMQRNKKNYYQLTWKQIRSKINSFKSIPEQYAEYLVKKGEIVLDDPMTLEETKKQIAKDNVEKCCAPKVKKAPKPSIISQWEEESLDEDSASDEDNFETSKTLGDDIAEKINKSGSAEKKLKLFPDDEEDEEEVKIVKKEVETKKHNKQKKVVERLPSSDSEDSDEELEGDDSSNTDFKNLSDMSEEELSEDDILDDGEFVTDSDEEE